MSVGSELSPAPWNGIFSRFRERLLAGGFDIVIPFRAGTYNDAVAPEYRLAAFDRPGSLVVLVGNTRRFWNPFVTAFETDRSLRDDPHPVDLYAERQVTDAARTTGTPFELRWAHLRAGPPAAVQKAAAVAGFAMTSPSSLTVHPDYGPWIAWRALVAFDVAGPAATPSLPADTCSGCEAPCVKALNRALACQPAQNPGNAEGLSHWKLWLEVRDACPLGKNWRYGENQIRYHYAKERDAIALP